MTNLEKELKKILAEMDSILKGGITLQECRDLYFKAKQKYFLASEKERTIEARIFMLDIFFQAAKVVKRFIFNSWQKGEYKPTNVELNLLKEGCEEVLAAFDNHFKDNLLAHYGCIFIFKEKGQGKMSRKLAN